MSTALGDISDRGARPHRPEPTHWRTTDGTRVCGRTTGGTTVFGPNVTCTDCLSILPGGTGDDS